MIYKLASIQIENCQKQTAVHGVLFLHNWLELVCRTMNIIVSNAK